jgi:hypothetical protein
MTKFLSSLGVISTLTFLALAAAGVCGYIWNIVKLIHHVQGVGGIDTEFVLRVVGICTGLVGAIYGYF